MSRKCPVTYNHDFYCTRCGKKGIPISRKLNHIRENGHLKKLFCIYCQGEVNHAEVVSGGRYNETVFLDEFNYGNFDREGNRIIPLNEWKALFYGFEEHISEEVNEDISLEEDEVEEWLKFFQSGSVASA